MSQRTCGVRLRGGLGEVLQNTVDILIAAFLEQSLFKP
jgi:hypothetical protein